MANTPTPYHPDAFTIKPHGDNRWEVIGADGRINSLLPDEASARFSALMLKRSFASAASGSPFATPGGLPSAPAPPMGGPGPGAAPLASPLPPSLLASMAASAAAFQGQPPPPPTPGASPQPSPQPASPGPYTPPTTFARSTWMPPRPAPPPGQQPPSVPPPGNVPPSPPASPGTGLGRIPRATPLGSYSAAPLGSFNNPLGAWAHVTRTRAVPHPPPPPPGGGRKPPRARKPPRKTPGGGFLGGGFAGAGAQVLVAVEALKILKSLIKAMTDFSEKVLESNRRLGQYNGQIAIAYTRLAISDFYRNTNLANRTATSSVELVKAVNRMRDSFQEYRVLQGNLLNQLAIGSARYFGNLGEALSPFFAKFNEMIGKDPKAGGIQTLADIMTFPLTKFFDDLKEILEKKLGVKFPDVKAGGPELGPWDHFAADVLNGRVGGPILPKAGPRPGIGGGAAINFGRGI